ncbi:hypothetical protein, partial [Thiolapillus sp.]
RNPRSIGDVNNPIIVSSHANRFTPKPAILLFLIAMSVPINATIAAIGTKIIPRKRIPNKELHCVMSLYFSCVLS